MALAGFNVLSAEEYDQPRKDFGLLPENEYRVKIDSYQLFTPNRPTEFNPDMKPSHMIFLTPIEVEGDPEEELLDTDGNPLDPEKRIVFFCDLDRMGLKPVVSKNRKFISAALGQPVTQGVTATSKEALLDSIVGKEVIVYVGVKNKKNNVMEVRPVKKASTRTRAPKATGDDLDF